MPALSVFALWLVLVSWRPLSLGFYHDDWHSIALPIELFSLPDLLSQDRSRAIYVILLWPLRWLLGSKAAAWQLLCALINLGCAVVIMRVVNTFGQPNPQSTSDWSHWSGAAAAIGWLAVPWSLAYTAWPIMAIPLLTIICLSLSMILLQTQPHTSRSACSAALIYLFGCAIYEAIWAAFLPIALLTALSRLKERASLFPILVYLTTALIGQFVLLALNRLLSTGSHGKTVSAAAFDIASRSVTSAPYQMAQAIGSTLLPFVASSLIVIGIPFLINTYRSRDINALGLVASCLLGFLIAAVLYAAAGYGIQWADLMARTAMVPTFWLVVAGGLVLRSGLAETGALRVGTAAAATVLLAALSLSAIATARDWAKGFREQTAVLSTFPIEYAGQLTPGTLVLADLPRNGTPRGQFDAFWDITGALAVTYPELVSRFYVHGKHRVSVLRPQDWWSEWDGAKVTQGWCRLGHQPLWSLDATEVLIWRQASNNFEKLAPNVRIGCLTGPS